LGDVSLMLREEIEEVLSKLPKDFIETYKVSILDLERYGTHDKEAWIQIKEPHSVMIFGESITEIKIYPECVDFKTKKCCASYFIGVKHSCVGMF
jgi:hypothetical protein